MATKNSAEMFAEIKNPVTENNIDSLKSFINRQSGLIKNLTAKISTLDEKIVRHPLIN